jgi:hypothetical protein
MIGAHFNAQVHADDSGGLGRGRPGAGAVVRSAVRPQSPIELTGVGG